MKKYVYLLIILPLIAFYSCEKEEENPKEENFDTVLVSYVYHEKYNGNNKTAEMGAKIYVYYDVNQTYFHSFTDDDYLEDGVFSNDNKSIKPDQIGTTDYAGKSEIILLHKDKELIVIIESNINTFKFSSYYPPLLEFQSYNQPILETTYTFNMPN